MEFQDFCNDDGKFLPREFAFYLQNQHEFLTMNETEQIYIKNPSVYRPKGESYIRQKVEEILPTDYKSPKKAKEDVIDSIKDSTRIDRKNFKEDPRYINLKNGVYDIENNEFIESKEEFMFRHEIPVKYDPDADCPEIKKFLHDLVRDEDVQILQELIGYCLYRDYPIAKAFMMYNTGQNGKTTFLNMLERFLGPKNVANPSIHDLLNNRFSKVELFGKLANINGDLDPDALESTGAFKRLTGGDTIRGERKYQSSFKFKNYAKLIYSANELPNTDDDTDAFFRRWVIVDFPYKFTEDPDDGHKMVEPDILDRICTEEEFSGLLNWALKGLKRVLDNNGFTSTQSTKDIKERWLMQSDSLKAFCELFVERDMDCAITKDKFEQVYRMYCYKANLNAKNRHKIGHQLPDIVNVLQERPTINGSRRHIWKGIRFSEDLELEDVDVCWWREEGSIYVREDRTDYVEESEDLGVVESGLKEKVLGFIEENGGEVGVDELYMHFYEFEEEVEGLVSDLKDEGVLFEPKKGLIGKV